jgi:hypothetical protein
MNMIALILLIVLVVFGYRIYQLKNYLNELEHYSDLRLILPLGFYIRTSIGMFCLSLFLIALSPVPALYAVTAVFGVLIDTLFTVLFYSAKYSRKHASSSMVHA